MVRLPAESFMVTSADYGLGPFQFGRGWFAVANSVDISKTPLSARYFGEDVILYRGESGRVVMLEAYCPHAGTHLGRSTHSRTVESGAQLEGDNIRCPFHGWRFGPDGVCNHIPYFDGPIPEGARLRSWPVEERYGIVFCWNDPERLAPNFALPEIPEWEHADFIRWTGLIHLGDLPCHPIEIFDNNSDYAHLTHTHGGRIRAYENEVDRHIYAQRQTLVGETEGVGNAFGDERVVSTINGYVGPGLNLARFLEINAVQLIAVTPLEDGAARMWQTVMARRPAGVDDKAAVRLLDVLNQNMAKGLAREDGEIWANKRPALQIMQLPTDGPFRQARIWYSQFFNPRDQADAIVKRVQGMHHVRGVAPFTAVAAE
jgi:3-ketosteroid 9alpha-monooxygenase subunit A